MFRSTGKHLSFPPEFRDGHKPASADGRYAIIKFTGAPIYFVFYLFIFPIIFFLGRITFQLQPQLDPFIRAVPSLFSLSLALFVVSCDDEDGTESDTICRPGCLPERPLDDNRHDLILLPLSYRPSHLLPR